MKNKRAKYNLDVENEIENYTIKKEKMVEFSSIDKQIWRLILSKLEFDEFFSISSVCKSIFFLLKEDEIFWSLFLRRNLNITHLPDQYKGWKEMMLSIYLFGWDKDTLDGNHEIDEKDEKILRRTNVMSKWKSVFTKNHLMEGVLYPFKILKLPKYNLTFGASISKSHKVISSYGVNEEMYGYYYYTDNFQGHTFFCNNGQGEQLSSDKRIEEGTTIYILIHKGSYNENKENSQATINFFNKQKDEKTPHYIFSFNVDLKKGQKFYGFLSTGQKELEIRLEKPVFEYGDNLLPSSLLCQTPLN